MELSDDVIDDSFTENSFNTSINTSIKHEKITENSCNFTKITVEEVDDSLVSNPRLSKNLDLLTVDNSNNEASIASKDECLSDNKLHTPIKDSDDEDEDEPCVTTKSNRRRRIIDSDSEDGSIKNNSYEDLGITHTSSKGDSFSTANEEDDDGSPQTNNDREEGEIIVSDQIFEQKSNESFRELRQINNDSSSSSSSEKSNDDGSDIIDVSSEEEQPLKEIKNNTLRQPTIQSMLGNITLKEVVDKPSQYFCSPVEYSNQATKVANLRTDALKCKNALRTVNLNSLPDKGALLRQRQNNLEHQLQIEELKLKQMILDTSQKEEKKISWDQLVANSNCVVPKTFGKQAMNTYSNQKTLTMDRLKHLHDSLATCPDEKTLAEDPKGLKIELMSHQRRALAWLMWREGQKPAGGILADDMGLGKTLTMISLILQTKEIEINDNNTESEDENETTEFSDKWRSKNKKLKPQGGTLVICPATLIGQWEGEVQKRIKRNLLNVELYHGTKRETKITRLAKYDIVITTYKLAQGEFEKKGPLFCIKWKRIILDEAHVVRNHKSQTSVAMCGLAAKTRWALTGTPVHNKELDLYALLKFLRCSPFDDLMVWKQWVANKNAGGQDRLNTVMTSILLRRTKVQLQNEGELQGLPEKKFEEIYVELDEDEKKVYQKVLLFSRNLFIEFLRQREAKNPELIYMRGAAPETQKTNDDQYNKMHKKILEMYGGANIKSHQILVLLLRLRQICCHPSLIHAILDDDNCETDGIEENGVDIDIFDKFANMNLEDVVPESVPSEPEDLNSAASKILSSTNPVFNTERPNEKLRIIQDIIEKKVIPVGDKIIIVSQWTSMLQIIFKHLKRSKIKCDLLDGSIPVHKRNDLVNCFNDPKQPIKVLLLSLTAGGVGLNLVGANHLLLVDLHWNPQLESQAQDRIYRVGQRKTVYVYKIITSETIEQRIKALQDSKLTMASDILAGTRAAAASKLSLNDLKMLFNIGPETQNTI